MLTHGATRHGRFTPEYRSWRSMITRCENERSPDYDSYGGCGIMVCTAWRESFEAFLRDVGPRPSPRHSLDRYPNPFGDYEPLNVRWAVPSEQSRNKRNNVWLTHDGVTLCMADWAQRLGIGKSTLCLRLKTMDVATALTPGRLRRGGDRKSARARAERSCQ